jgi:hypothetical protein
LAEWREGERRRQKRRRRESEKGRERQALEMWQQRPLSGGREETLTETWRAGLYRRQRAKERERGRERGERRRERVNEEGHVGLSYKIMQKCITLITLR